MEYQERENELLEMFPDYMRFRWTNLAKKIENLREIRLRVNQPILIYDNNGEHYLTAEGIVTNKIQEAYKSRATEIEEIINHVCEYSLYAYENEFRQGYFTVQGGHRIGIGGKIITDSGKVKNMKHISYVNIRISHQVVGIANPLMRYLYDESGLKNILIL